MESDLMAKGDIGQQVFPSPDDVKNPDPLAVIAVKYAARRLDDLAVTRAEALRAPDPLLG
jgi:hypothetical protein